MCPVMPFCPVSICPLKPVTMTNCSQFETPMRTTSMQMRFPETSFFKDTDFIFQQDLAPAHTAKSTKSWLNDHGVGVLDWPANSPDLNPR